MFDEEDLHEFLDVLYQLWSKTTGAEGSYWVPEETTDDGWDRCWVLISVNQVNTKRYLIASGLREADAEFIAGMHGAVPDLIRRLHEAIDEAQRLDAARDGAEERYAEEVLENMRLRQLVADLTAQR